jgi:phosphohistidine phosphatase SixA
LALAFGAALEAEGIALGGLAAAAVQAANGDFAIAGQTLSSIGDDIDKATAKAESRIDKIWDGTYRKSGEDAAKTADRLKKALERQNAETAKGATEAEKAAEAIDKQVQALQEQAATVGMTTREATLYKLAQDGATEAQLKSATAALAVVDAYEKGQKAIKDQTERLDAFKQVQESTFTDGQKLLNDYQKSVETLRASLNAGDINQNQYDHVMDGLDQGLSKSQDKLDETKDQISVFADEAARNAQDAFADFLFDPFADGVDGMAANFGKVIQRMVAEAAAAQLMELALGEKGADGQRTGGFLAAGMKVASAWFGGMRAVGGPVEAGKLYEVGENDRPEMFMANGRQFMIPGNSGSIKPQGVPGGNSTQVFNITTPDANSFRASQRQIARRAKSKMSQT